jgi:hypothetical protein
MLEIIWDPIYSPNKIVGTSQDSLKLTTQQTESNYVKKLNRALPNVPRPRYGLLNTQRVSHSLPRCPGKPSTARSRFFRIV